MNKKNASYFEILLHVWGKCGGNRLKKILTDNQLGFF